MLILSRHRDELVVITIPEGLPAGTRLLVMVVDIRGDKCRIGFEAPSDVEVDRLEIREAKDRDIAAGRRR